MFQTFFVDDISHYLKQNNSPLSHKQVGGKEAKRRKSPLFWVPFLQRFLDYSNGNLPLRAYIKEICTYFKLFKPLMVLKMTHILTIKQGFYHDIKYEGRNCPKLNLVCSFHKLNYTFICRKINNTTYFMVINLK